MELIVCYWKVKVGNGKFVYDIVFLLCGKYGECWCLVGWVDRVVDSLDWFLIRVCLRMIFNFYFFVVFF